MMASHCSWPVWDLDLKSVTLKDKGAASQNLEGAKGNLTMKSGMSFDFTIHNVLANKYIAYETKLPGASADWYWSFKTNETQPDHVDLDMGVKITGPFTFVYKWLMGSQLDPTFTKCNENLKSLIEEGHINGEKHEFI